MDENIIQFDSADIYIEGATSLRDKITRIEAVISALMGSALRSASKGEISEYMLDDGQTRINTIYRSPDAILSAIQSFEKIKFMFINQLNGRVMRNVDSKNFNNRRYSGRR